MTARYVVTLIQFTQYHDPNFAAIMVILRQGNSKLKNCWHCLTVSMLLALN